MKFTYRHTSPGGRVFAFVAAVLVLTMAFAAAVVAVDAFDGSASVSIRRGRGRLTPDGWQAYLYGTSVAAAGASFLAIGVAFAAAALLPGRVLRHALPLLAFGFYALVVAAGLAMVFTVVMLFDP